jgi:DNA replication protein DnaC
MDQMVFSLEKQMVTQTCEKHGEYTGEAFRSGPGQEWHNPPCNACWEEEKAAMERRVKTAEAAREEKRQERVATYLKKSGLPLRWEGRGFSAYVPHSDGARKALDVCQRYAQDFPEMQRLGACLVMGGKPGTGKSHLAASIVKYVIREHVKSAIYLTILKAIRQVKETYRKGSETTEQEAIDALAKPDLLVLDEVGVQYGTDAEKQIAFEIINTRYENLQPTIIISNLNAAELTAFIGERVMDRLKEKGGRLLAFGWQSYRGAARERISAE